jgi:hypothetical protein
VIEVVPLTDQVLMVHFKDGYASYHQRGEKRNNERVIVEPLNWINASQKEFYIISSLDDSFYEQGVSPEEISRKTKGTAFTWLCEGWNEQGCVNQSPDHVKEHWIYLFLPKKMESGYSYTLNTTNLAKNGQRWTILFDEKKNRSEAVHVNLIGYSPLAPKKYGYVYHWMGDKGGLILSDYKDNPFHLLREGTNEITFTGKLKFRKGASNIETYQVDDTPNQNFIGAEVYECDFSEFNTPGDYLLVVEGIGHSFPFKIERDVFRESYYHLIRGLYHNRSGIALEEPHTIYTRPAPHNPVITPGFENKLLYTSSRFIDWIDGNYSDMDTSRIIKEINGPISTWGWYQDAGDWDGYFSHMSIPALLMLTFELVPDNFSDGELKIPESGNGIPDILDEASWLIRFFYRTRQQILDRGYGTGGIGSRITGDHFGGDQEGIASYDDVERNWIISGEDPHSTFKYAALAGQLAYILKKIGANDPENVNWEVEANEAFEWAELNILPGDEETKPAMPYRLSDIRMYAAASLYRLTGDTTYHKIFKEDSKNITSTSILQQEQRWGPFIYSLLDPAQIIDPELYHNIQSAILETADYLMNDFVERRACRWGGNMYMPMLIGQATTPLVIEGMMGWALVRESDPSRASRYLQNIYTTCDYFLGTNPLNMAWATHLGERNPERVFHMDSWYNGRHDMAPGIIPYGPWRHQDQGPQIGPWDLRWPYKSIYPEDIHKWPGHERWFNNYTCPANAEFTVHQNTVMAAVAFGFLCDKSNENFIPNRKPSISIIDPIPHSKISSAPLKIQVEVSDPDGTETIRRVEFYNDWHLIGTIKDSPFTFNWDHVKEGTLKLSARVFDREGSYGISDTIIVYSDVILGRFQPNLSAEIVVKIFPNPTYRTLYIDALHQKVNYIVIYDKSGKIILRKELQSRSEKTGPMELKLPAGIPSGLYTYQVETGRKERVMISSGKIVIQ